MAGGVTNNAAVNSPPPIAEGEKLTPAYLALFRELCDLKRIHSADRAGSLAARLFAAGWSALLGPDDPRHAMLRTVAAALAAARLGDLDLARLTSLGLDRGEATEVLERAFDQVAAALDPVLAALAAPAFGGDPTHAFVAGIAHHLHNAAMPDSGYTGEILLGHRLDRVITTAREQALATLPPPRSGQSHAGGAGGDRR